MGTKFPPPLHSYHCVEFVPLHICPCGKNALLSPSQLPAQLIWPSVTWLQLTGLKDPKAHTAQEVLFATLHAYPFT